MTRSERNNGNGRRLRRWVRRLHRWIGIGVALFALLLAGTGIALNHVEDWGLDERYVASDWLLDAYGIEIPPPGPSFVDRGHRVTQLGQRTFLDLVELPLTIDEPTGLASLDPLIVLSGSSNVHVLTNTGEVVEILDARDWLRGPIDRLGRTANLPVIESNGSLWIGDADVSAFSLAADVDRADVVWSTEQPLTATDRDALATAYRGRGLTLERVLADLHSGRIAGAAGPWLADLAGIGIIVLAVSGLFVWVQRRSR